MLKQDMSKQDLISSNVSIYVRVSYSVWHGKSGEEDLASDPLCGNGTGIGARTFPFTFVPLPFGPSKAIRQCLKSKA